MCTTFRALKQVMFLMACRQRHFMMYRYGHYQLQVGARGLKSFQLLRLFRTRVHHRAQVVHQSGHVTSNSVVVTWTAPQTDLTITKYLVQWIKAPGFSIAERPTAQAPVDWKDAQSAETQGNSTSITLLGLDSSTIYLVRVRAVTDEILGEWSLSVAVETESSTTTGPGIGPGPGPGPVLVMPAPQNVIGDVLSSTSIQVAWAPVSPPQGLLLSGYKVEWRQSGSVSWDPHVTTDTQHTITGLAEATPYNIRVTAIGSKSSDGSSVNSAIASGSDVTTEGDLSMPPPTGVSASVASSTSIKVSWNAVSPPRGLTLTGYRVQWKTITDFDWQKETVGKVTEHIITGLSENTLYETAVRANGVSSSGSSEASSVIPGPDVTTQAVLPSPTGLSGLVVSPTSIKLTWHAVSPPPGMTLSDYTVQWRASGQDWSSHTTSATEHTITGLEESTTYDFRVRANGSPADSPFSSVENETSGASSLTSPTGVSGSAESTTSIKITWNAVTPSAGLTLSGYKVEWRKSSDTNWMDHTTAATDYTITGLSENTTYNIRVTAQGTGFGSPADSSPAHGQDVSTPASVTMPPPSGVAGTALSTSSIKVTWTAPTVPAGVTLTEYTVEWREIAASSWTSATVSAPVIEYTMSGLSEYTEYSFRVTASGTDDSLSSISSIAVTGSSVTTKFVETLPAPANLVACSTTPTSSGLTWTGITLPAGYTGLNYTVQHKIAGENWTSSSAGTSTSYTVTGLTASTDYVFRVIASAANPLGQTVREESGEVIGSTQGLTLATKPTLRVVGLYQNTVYWDGDDHSACPKISWNCSV